MPKPVIALVGDESFLQLQKLQQIIAQFPADVQRVDFDGTRAELSDVLDELRSFAMFGSVKLIVVRDADEFISRFREPLEEYICNPSDSATLVLRISSLPANQRIYKAIAKVGAIEPCEPPKERDLPAWIMNRGKSEYKIATMLISHDIRVISRLADNVVVMYGGTVVEYGPAPDVLAARFNPKHPYTAALLASIPSAQNVRDHGDLSAVDVTLTDGKTHRRLVSGYRSIR